MRDKRPYKGTPSTTVGQTNGRIRKLEKAQRDFGNERYSVCVQVLGDSTLEKVKVWRYERGLK
jgi:hypothetical protein